MGPPDKATTMQTFRSAPGSIGWKAGLYCGGIIRWHLSVKSRLTRPPATTNPFRHFGG